MLGRCVLMVSIAMAATPVAHACPPMPDGEGGYHCSKYDRLMQRDVPTVVMRYRRARPLRLPRRLTGAAAMRVLTTSAWIAEGAARGPTRVKLVDASSTTPVTPNLATMAVAAVTWQAGHYRVDLGGVTYQLERCRATTCLVLAPTP